MTLGLQDTESLVPWRSDDSEDCGIFVTHRDRDKYSRTSGLSGLQSLSADLRFLPRLALAQSE